MKHQPDDQVQSTWHQIAPDAPLDFATSRRSVRAAELARRARIRYHARWIVINLLLIGVGAWLFVNVLIPRFITKELSTQAAALVHADYDGSAPETTSRSRPVRAVSASPDRHERMPRRSTRESPPTPKPAYASSAMLKELGAQCVDRRVFRKTVTNGVTEITEVTGLRC